MNYTRVINGKKLNTSNDPLIILNISQLSIHKTRNRDNYILSRDCNYNCHLTHCNVITTISGYFQG